MSYEFMEAHREEYPISRMSQVLEVSRQGYYDWRSRTPSQRQQADADLAEQIRHIHAASYSTYGSPRLQAVLQEMGIACGQRRIRRLMQQMGLSVRYAKRKKPRTTCSDPDHFKFPNHLDRHFEAEAPNRKWLSDITYIHTTQGWVYAAAIMDLYSRRIVGLAIDIHMETELVERALEMALQERRPEPGLLHHSDQGSQYTSWDYTTLLDLHQITISMSRKGQCWDNSPMESFWGTLKTECVAYQFEDVKEARSTIFAYIMGWYNRQRRHSALDYLSPEQFEQLKLWTQ